MPNAVAESVAKTAATSAATQAESVAVSSAAVTVAETTAVSSATSSVAETTATSSAAQSAAASSAVAAKYELKLPEKSGLPESLVERTAALARERGLSNADAQRLLDDLVAERSAASAELVAGWEPRKGALWIARDRDLKAQALADAEVGGTPEKLAASAATAERVLARFFSKDVGEFLRVSGMGSHPEFLRGLVRIGRGMSEDGLVRGPSGNTETNRPKSMAEKMYGKDGTGKKQGAESA